jgi:uncharacterized oxidoreductase
MRIKAATAAEVAAGILAALGAPAASAQRVAASLLAADRRGVGTHGLSLLPLYADLVRAGVIDPAAQPAVEPLGDCLARVAGQGAFGQLTGERAVDLGLELLPRQGIAAVGIVDGTHLGRLGEWAERACDQGAAFLAFTNTAGGALNVAGPGGAGRVLSTNPLAIGIPTCGALAHHVIVDFAASQVSGSRIRETANAGGRLDPDWVVTGSGESTDDPFAFLEGAAALRPLGGRSAGHKGFGLMVASELLAALAGGLMAGERETPGFSNGALFCLLDVRRFSAPRQWGERARHFRDYLAARGYRLPGAGRGAEDSDGSIELADHALAAMIDLARELAVDTLGLCRPGAGGGTVTRTW